MGCCSSCFPEIVFEKRTLWLPSSESLAQAAEVNADSEIAADANVDLETDEYAVVSRISGSSLRVHFQKGDTVANIKAQLTRAWDIPQCYQHLFLEATELHVKRTLLEQGVKSGSNIQLLIARKMSWGRHSPCFEKTHDGTLLTKVSDDSAAWMGGMSDLPLPRDHRASVILNAGVPDGTLPLAGDRPESRTSGMYSYFGLVSEELQTEGNAKSYEAKQKILYFTDGATCCGIHDSRYKADAGSRTDWRTDVVPPISSGTELSVMHTSEGEVLFFICDKQVYSYRGYFQDLHLFWSGTFPGESARLCDLQPHSKEDGIA